MTIKSKQVKAKYEVAVIDNVELSIDITKLMKSDTMYFNATEIAKYFGKDLSNFTKDKKTLEYIKLIELDLRSVDSTDLKSIKVVLGKGKRQGTWMHQKLALCFARWCSVEFEFKLDRWIESRLKEQAHWQLSRDALKLNYRPMTDAIQEQHRLQHGTDPDKWIYIGEADMINRVVFGMTAKQFREKHDVKEVRDALDELSLKRLEKVQRMNASLLEMGWSFQARYDQLVDVYQPKKIK